MSQASTLLTGQGYFIGNSSVVPLRSGQWVALKREGIQNIGDLVKFKDDDIDNVTLNLRQPQDIWHLTIPTWKRSAEIAVNNAVVHPVPFRAAVTRRDRVDAWTKKQHPLVCSALLVKKMKLTADIVCYYTGIRQPQIKENMEYAILKDYNDHIKLVKALRKDQDIKLM